MRRPNCSSSLVEGRNDIFEEVDRWHQRLQLIGKEFHHNKHREGWILNAQYEPRIHKGCSWYRCRHMVQARLSTKDTYLSKAFSFDLGKDDTDETFKAAISKAMADAKTWFDDRMLRR